MPLILDHVDLRVRDRLAATEFYDAFLSLLGAVKREGEEFTTWCIPPVGGAIDDAPDNVGIVQDPQHVPGAMRVAFKASARAVIDAIAKLLVARGARNVEMDDGIYGDDFYGVFFEDFDGNKLEVCFNGEPPKAL